MKQLNHYEVLDPAAAEAVVQKGVLVMHGVVFIGMLARVEGKAEEHYNDDHYIVIPPDLDKYCNVAEMAGFDSVMDLIVEYTQRGMSFFKL